MFSLLGLLILSLGLVLGKMSFGSDQSPEGAYLRVTKAVSRNAAVEFFAYLEEPAQHACFSILTYRKKSLQRAKETYPPAALEQLRKSIGSLAQAKAGPDVFAQIAEREGWLDQLRLDMSGVARVDQSEARATVLTKRGSRYSFRQRPNGIWGMTAFTAALVAEAEAAARDAQLVEGSAADYERAAR